MDSINLFRIFPMIKNIFCIFLAAWTASSSPVFAGGFRGRKIVCQPIVKQQIIQDHVVQQFNVVENVDVIQKQVQFDADYFLGMNGYYDVVNQLQAQEINADKDIILKQSEQVDRLIRLLEESLKQNISPSTDSNPEPTQEEPKEEPQDVGSTDQPTATNELAQLNQKVFTIFSENCSSCHGQSSQKAGLQLVGEEDSGEKWLADLPLADRVSTYDHVAGINLQARGKKLMPLGGPALADEDVEAIRLWMVAKTEEKSGE